MIKILTNIFHITGNSKKKKKNMKITVHLTSINNFSFEQDEVGYDILPPDGIRFFQEPTSTAWLAVSTGDDATGICCDGEGYLWCDTLIYACGTTFHYSLS